MRIEVQSPAQHFLLSYLFVYLFIFLFVSLLDYLFVLQCHACAAVQTAEAVDRR